MNRTLLTWSWLNILTKKRSDALCKAYGDLETALQHVDEELLRNLGCKEDTCYIVLNRLDEFDPGAYEKELQKRELTFVTLEDDAYPQQLKNIADPPMFLYARGDLSILEQPCIGVVGTRDMSQYGQRVTEELVTAFIRADLVTVSGLAKGVDAECAKQSMHCGGKTAAVLGHGLAGIYPSSNKRLAEEIVSNGGVLLSEYPLDITPDTYTFPARNRIIAGLSLGTVVTEAGEGSGALITAELALEYGREVFAVPGQIFDDNYKGCHRFISSGQAKLVTSAEDVLSEFGIAASARESSGFTPEQPTEESVYGALTSMPQSVSDIVERCGMATAAVNATLTMMELRGGAKNVGSGMWVRA